MSSYNSRKTIPDLNGDKLFSDTADMQGNSIFEFYERMKIIDQLYQESTLQLPKGLTEVEREYGLDNKSTVVVYSKKKENIDDKIGKRMNCIMLLKIK